MKRIKEAIHLLLALPVLCAALSGFARADGPDAVWAKLAETPDGVSAVLEANTPVSDGVIQVAFDPDKLTYASFDFAGQQGEYQSQAAMYAVNDAQAEEGVVRISWVAPQDLAPGQGQSLSTGGKEELPPTGDTAHVGVYLTLAAASAAALGAAAVWSRQRRGAK